MDGRSITIIVWDWFHLYINHEEAFILPYFVPLCFWSLCYLYSCYLVYSSSKSSSSKQPSTVSSSSQLDTKATTTTKETNTIAVVVPFHKWYTIHNIHNFGAIILGTLSICTGYLHDQNINNNNNKYHFIFVLNERVPILWSLSYFTIDSIDCFVRNDRIYLLHAICCFVLGYMNYTIPILRILHMNSKAAYCECSNPFMHLVKRTKEPMHFVYFFIVFTFCRILWIPYLYYQLITFNTDRTSTNNTTIQALSWYHPICGILFAFYLLNVYWYYKMIRILINGGNNNNNNNSSSSSSSSNATKEKSN